MEFFPPGAELWTDMTKLIAAFRNFATAPKVTASLAVFCPHILCR